jgi:phosphoserine phosphatase RsbU/P
VPEGAELAHDARGMKRRLEQWEVAMATVIETNLRDQLLSRQRRLQALARNDQRSYVQELIQEVDDALQRMDDGCFGICEVCQDPVEEQRILANPLCRVCLDHLSPDEMRALESDLELASRVQMGLLPPPHVEFGGWEMHTCYQPLGPVSGDYYDLLRRDRDSLLLFGDIAGKGVAASILMSSLHALFRSLAATDLPVAEMVGRAGRLFCEATLAGSYATLVCATVGATGCVELVNAGHLPPLVRTRRGVESLPATGLPVGLFANAEYVTHRFDLEADDFLLFYTDGLSEARNAMGDEYGLARIEGAVREAAHPGAAALTATLLDNVAAFRNGTPDNDDLTVTVLRRAS